MLLVRARKAGEIEAAFPKAKTWIDRAGDYTHRAEELADTVAQVLPERLRGIRYGNFKSSVPERGQHEADMDV